MQFSSTIMKKPILLLTIASAFISSTAWTQNEEDALRFSQQWTPASARSWGMGGAMGALGADLSSFFSNPAGLGAYKRGSIELSLGLTDVRTTSDYVGSSHSDFATRMELNNFAVVGGQKANESGLTFNFGVAYAKSNQFAQRLRIEGDVSNSSILDVFAAQAGGLSMADVSNTFPFTAGAALAVDGIVPSSDSSFYSPNAQGKLRQTKNIVRKGYQSITAFAFGMGVKDKLFLGMAINFHGSRLVQDSDHQEDYQPNQSISKFVYSDDLNSDGSGFSVRIGFLAKPTQWLRVGAAVQTATAMTIRESWDVNTSSESTAQGYQVYNSSTLITDYNLHIPARYMANIAFVLGKAGSVAADYEYINYNNIRMDGAGLNNNYDYAAENAVIQTSYRGTHKVSAGMEWRLPYRLYLRAGATYAQSPYYKDVMDNPSMISYHMGMGYKKDNWFLDLGLASYQTQSTVYVYDPSIASPANIISNTVRGLLSAGLRF
jgi:long-subunit fatty acid transport protein